MNNNITAPAASSLATFKEEMVEFTSTDMCLVAALAFMGYPLIRFDKFQNKATFYLEAPKSMLKQYDLGQLRVEPNEFSGIIRRLSAAVKR